MCTNLAIERGPHFVSIIYIYIQDDGPRSPDLSGIVHWGNDEYTCCNFGDVQMETTKMKLQLNGYFLYL